MDGGKKDAKFILNCFKSKVDEFDLPTVYTDSFFDRADNVQKAGQILFLHFPQAMCSHGGEHLLSLFFSDLSRVDAIKVSFFMHYIYNLHHSHFLFATCLESMQTL